MAEPAAELNRERTAAKHMYWARSASLTPATTVVPKKLDEKTFWVNFFTQLTAIVGKSRRHRETRRHPRPRRTLCEVRGI